MTPSTKATPLKPCPFCGADANWWFQQVPERCSVRCVNEDCDMQTGLLESKETATRRWNTRAAHDTLLAERDRYRSALQKIAVIGHGANCWPMPDNSYRCNCHVAIAATALKEGE